MFPGSAEVEQRVIAAANQALRNTGSVKVIDVLMRLQWLAASAADYWQQGRTESLDTDIQVGPEKLVFALDVLRRWASDEGLVAVELEYQSRTPHRRELRFSVDGHPEIERFYRTAWLSPSSDAERKRVVDKIGAQPELVAIWARRDWTCAECSQTGELLIMEGDGPLCMRCAGLDHLEYLEAGNSGVTRRAKKASTLSAVVVRFSRTRKRYERVGVLVEKEALAKARVRGVPS